MARISGPQLSVLGAILVTGTLSMGAVPSAHAGSLSAQPCADKLSPEAQAIYIAHDLEEFLVA
jgi:hypothetical protein